MLLLSLVGDRGRRGTVSRVFDGKRVIVDTINMVKKHIKPNPNTAIVGGIIEKEAPDQYF